MSSACWENKCHRCGLCCHEKVLYSGQLVIDLDSWCEFFDPKTKQCKIYAERFIRSLRCKKMTRLRAMFASYLAPSCAYVEWAQQKGLRFAKKRRLRFIHSKTKESEDSDDPIYNVF